MKLNLALRWQFYSSLLADSLNVINIIYLYWKFLLYRPKSTPSSQPSANGVQTEGLEYARLKQVGTQCASFNHSFLKGDRGPCTHTLYTWEYSKRLHSCKYFRQIKVAIFILYSASQFFSGSVSSL